MTVSLSGARWLLLGLVGLLLFFINPLSELASQYNQEVTVGSSTLYGTLRVVNSVMSVAKETEVQASSVFLSLTASPGQLLQPVTNTIDRMSDLLFCLAITSGVLSLILVPIATVAAAILGVLGLAKAVVTFSGVVMPASMQNLGRRLFLLALMGAVIVPASYSLAFLVGDRITEDAWVEAKEVFHRLDSQYDDAVVHGQLEALKVPENPSPAMDTPTGEEPGLLDRLGSAVDASRSAIGSTVSAATDLAASVGNGISNNTKAVLDGVAISADLFRASIQIAIAYLVKLLILPLLFIYIAAYLLRANRSDSRNVAE